MTDQTRLREEGARCIVAVVVVVAVEANDGHRSSILISHQHHISIYIFRGIQFNVHARTSIHFAWVLSTRRKRYVYNLYKYNSLSLSLFLFVGMFVSMRLDFYFDVLFFLHFHFACILIFPFKLNINSTGELISFFSSLFLRFLLLFLFIIIVVEFLWEFSIRSQTICMHTKRYRERKLYGQYTAERDGRRQRR